MTPYNSVIRPVQIAGLCLLLSLCGVQCHEPPPIVEGRQCPDRRDPWAADAFEPEWLNACGHVGGGEP